MSPMLPLFVLLLLPSLPLVTCDDDITVQSLMTLVQQQAATIQTMQAKLTSLQNSAEQSLATIQTLQTKVTSLERSETTLQATVASLQSSVQQFLTTEQQHTGQIAAINSRLNTQVFFTAYMSQEPVDIGTSNAPLKFDAVINNVGNGYNPQTGVFTAPVTGTYVMYAQIMKHGVQAGLHYAIDKSGTILCLNSVDYADWDKSSCLASVHVQKGETVIVRRNGGGQIIEGSWFCAFSGFLLSADAN